MNKKIAVLQELKAQIDELPIRGSGQLDSLKQRASMLINKMFGNTSDYHGTLNKIRFTPVLVVTGTGSEAYTSAWKLGCAKFANLVDTMIEDLSIDLGVEIESPVNKFQEAGSDEIFIVHGHNVEIKESVARIIDKLGLKPIILHEQPNRGRTIIQKFIDYSSVRFALVIMSGDDIGRSASEDSSADKRRARQNVILELGFFLGKLGPENVIALVESSIELEAPSDYDGVIYLPYDADGRWKFDLVRELKASGYKVDANAIL